ncbi:MAG: hypothetical protein ISS66_13470 [Desulfobacteraceae bacterium]|nr:hypothetical protein [Desulfobacteraceae bacterium]
MEAAIQIHRSEEPAYPRFSTIQTTLYELIEALNEELEPEEDWLVNAIVLDMLSNWQIRLLNRVGVSFS